MQWAVAPMLQGLGSGLLTAKPPLEGKKEKKWSFLTVLNAGEQLLGTLLLR